MSGIRFRRARLISPRAVVPTFLFVALAQTMLRFVRIRVGGLRPHVDVRCCWRPVATAVLSGQPLYVRPAVDNKPPLFELLNLAVAATGRYLLVFLILVGVANAAVAVLLWQYCARRGAPRTGLVAGGLFLAAVPVAGGMAVNVRSFAIVGVVLALTLRGPVARGATVAAAGLVSQHAVFAVPVLAYLRLREFDGQRRRVRWGALFGAAGLAVVAASFAVVAAIWGVQSLRGGLYWTFGAAGGYATNPSVPSLVGNTRWWALALTDYAMGHLVVLLPALLVVGLVLVEETPRGLRESTAVPVGTAALLAAAMSVPLLVRAYPAYWLYPMPFLALLSSVAFERLFRPHR